MQIEDLIKKEAVTSQAVFVQEYDFTLFITRYGQEEIEEFYYPQIGLNMVRGIDIMRDLKNGWAMPDEGLSSYVNDRIEFSVTGMMSSGQIDTLARLTNDYFTAVMLHEEYYNKRLKETENEKISVD